MVAYQSHRCTNFSDNGKTFIGSFPFISSCSVPAASLNILYVRGCDESKDYTIMEIISADRFAKAVRKYNRKYK